MLFVTYYSVNSLILILCQIVLCVPEGATPGCVFWLPFFSPILADYLEGGSLESVEIFHQQKIYLSLR